MIPPSPSSTLFPYTTLFRSRRDLVGIDPHHQVVDVIVDLREPVARARRNHDDVRSEEHTSELQSLRHLVCRLLLEKKKQTNNTTYSTVQNQHPDKNKAQAPA